MPKRVAPDKKSFEFLHCYINDGLSPYGIFVGMTLAAWKRSDKKQLIRLRDSEEFHDQVSSDLEKFIESTEFTIENIESHFKR